MFDQEEKSDHNSIFNLSELLRSEHVRTRFCDLNTHTHMWMYTHATHSSCLHPSSFTRRPVGKEAELNEHRVQELQVMLLFWKINVII